MIKRPFQTICLVFAVLCPWGELPAKPPPEVAYEQRVGSTLPLDLPLLDPADERVTFRELLDGRPLILGMGYNRCPMLCGVQIQGLLQVLLQIDPKLGGDYSVAFLSVDPDETPELATEARRNFIAAMGLERSGAVHFLRGEATAVRHVAEAIGFSYESVPESGQYAHPAGWLVVTPEGVISAYELGVRYDGETFASDLGRASGGEVGAAKPSLLLRCLQYDPLEGPYGRVIKASLQALAGLTLLALVFWIVRAERKKRKEEAK